MGDAVGFPSSGTVFDYYVDLTGPRGSDLRSWCECTPSFQYDKRKPYFQMLVPTLDTVRFSFLLEVWLTAAECCAFWHRTATPPGLPASQQMHLQRLVGASGACGCSPLRLGA